MAFVGAGKEPTARRADDPAGARRRRRLRRRGRSRRRPDLLQFRDDKGARPRKCRRTSPPPPACKSRTGAIRPFYVAEAGEELHFSGGAARVAFGGPLSSASGSAPTTRTKWSRRASATSSCNPPRAGEAAGPVQHARNPAARHSTDRRVEYVTDALRGAELVAGRQGCSSTPAAGSEIPAAAARRRPYTGSPTAATTTTASRRTARQSSSATSPKARPPRRTSRIYTLPVAGGEPTLVTPNAPSYWHGWSPDGRPWPTAPSGTANTTSTPSRSAAARRRG